jgi:hypothetical protein
MYDDSNRLKEPGPGQQEILTFDFPPDSLTDRLLKPSGCNDRQTAPCCQKPT